MVRSPVISNVSSSIGVIAGRGERSCGWLSASKKSAERRWASRWGSLVSTEATSTVPVAVTVERPSPISKRALEGVEGAADGGDAQVLDLELDVGMGGVDGPGAGRDDGRDLLDDGHSVPLLAKSCCLPCCPDGLYTVCNKDPPGRPRAEWQDLPDAWTFVARATTSLRDPPGRSPAQTAPTSAAQTQFARPRRPPTGARRGGPARPWTPGRRAACSRRGRCQVASSIW